MPKRSIIVLLPDKFSRILVLDSQVPTSDEHTDWGGAESVDDESLLFILANMDSFKRYNLFWWEFLADREFLLI